MNIDDPDLEMTSVPPDELMFGYNIRPGIAELYIQGHDDCEIEDHRISRVDRELILYVDYLDPTADTDDTKTLVVTVIPGTPLYESIATGQITEKFHDFLDELT